MEQEYITASELGDYVFCKRGWWLRKKGLLSIPTQAMIEGTEGYDNIFLQLQALRLRTFVAWVFLLIGAVLMLYIIISQL